MVMPAQEKKLPVALVAGGASFLGSALCEALLLQNLKVYCLDNLITGRRENLLELETKPNFRFIEADITTPRAFIYKGLSYIFHLAGEAEYLDGFDISLESLVVNALGTKRLLDLAQKTRAKFLLVSSFDIYSGFLSSLSLEYYFGPSKLAEKKFSHHEAKRFAEALVFAYFKRYNVDARIVRLADVYGPKMTLGTGTILGELVTAALKGNPLRVNGEGLTVCYPTYVTDIVYGLVKAMFNEDTKGKIYNLVNPEETTVVNLVETMKKLKANLRIVFSKEKEELKFPVRKAELLETQRDLGWRPKVTLQAGLKKTFDWFESGPKRMKKVRAELKVQENQLQVEKDRLEKEIEELKPPPKLEEEEKLLVEVEEIREEKETKEEPPPEASLIEIKSSAQPPTPELEKPVIVTESILSQFSELIKKQKIRLPQLRPKPLPKLKLASPKFGRPSLKLSLPSLTTRRLVFLFSLVILFVGIFYPVGSFVFFAASGAQHLKDTYQAISQKDILVAQNHAQLAETRLLKAKGTLATLNYLFLMLKKQEEIQSWDLLLNASVQVAGALKHASAAWPPLFKGVKSILSAEQGELGSLVEEAKLELDGAIDRLKLAEGEFKNINTSDFPAFLRANIEKLSWEVPKACEKLTNLRLVLTFLPEIAGFEGSRTYLLLLQNNMELRPGGGFIGSYGLINFVGGKLTKIEIEDVYTVDGALAEAVLPPLQIKEYLGQNTWYFRDSNFSAHFPTNAAQAEWFLEKSLGIKVDGVIGLDLSVIGNLLSVIGPVEVIDYQETIDEKNVFERTEYHSEVDFFPGSTSKRDFLGSLARTIIDQTFHAPEEKWAQLAAALARSIEEKHLMIYLHNPQLAKLLARERWDGAVLIQPSVSGNESFDYLMIVDANLGANKVNYFLRRKVSHLVVIDKEGGVAERLTIEYDNQSPAESWPGGKYRNYLRVYVPSGSVLNKVAIGDVTDPALVEKGRELGKTVFGMNVEVPIKSKKTVTLEYQPPKTLEFLGGVGTYRLLVQKQPGVIEDPLVVTVNYPSFMKIVKSEPIGKGSDQAIRYSTTLEKDREFRIEFIK